MLIFINNDLDTILKFVIEEYREYNELLQWELVEIISTEIIQSITNIDWFSLITYYKFIINPWRIEECTVKYYKLIIE